MNVSERPLVNDFKQHVTLVLIKPLRRLINVVICTFIRAAHDLYNVSFRKGSFILQAYHNLNFFVVHAVIVDRWLEKVRVLLEPSARLLVCEVQGLAGQDSNLPFRNIQRT